MPRQVLYQTVSDPQQRIAKLTAKDPRRRRTSSGSGSLPGGGRRPSDEGNEERRTSLPGSHRFGWKPSTPPPRPADEPNDPANDSTTAWGSPINTPDDVSMESNADQALEEENHGVDAGVESSDDGKGESDNDSAVELADPTPDVRSDGPEGVNFDFEGEPESQLYSESESEGGEDGVEERKGGIDEFNDDRHGNGGSGTGVAWVGGVDDPHVGEGRAPMAPLDAGDDGGRNPAPGDQTQNDLVHSPGTGLAPNWAETSSSEDTESPGSARADVAAAQEAATHVPAVSQADDATTAPTFPPAAGRGSAAPETSGIHITGSSDTYVGGSSDTYYGGPSHTYITGSAATRTEEARGSGGPFDGSNSGSAASRTGGGARTDDGRGSGRPFDGSPSGSAAFQTGGGTRTEEVRGSGGPFDGSNFGSSAVRTGGGTRTEEARGSGGPSGGSNSGSAALRTGEVNDSGGHTTGPNSGSAAVRTGGGTRTEEARGSGGPPDGSTSGSAAVPTGGGTRTGVGLASGVVPGVDVEGSAAVPIGEVPGAERPSRTHGTDPTAARREELPHSSPLAERVSDARISDDPSRRITWGADHVEEGPVGPRENERRRVEQREPAVGASRYGGQAGSRFASGDSGHNHQRLADKGGDESLEPDALNSSVESGGGAAALAASGVFDVTGTSAEVDESREGGESIGDLDSLDGTGVQGGPWARQHAASDDDGRRTGVGNSGGVLPADDTRGLIQDLMRQVCHLTWKQSGHRIGCAYRRFFCALALESKLGKSTVQVSLTHLSLVVAASRSDRRAESFERFPGGGSATAEGGTEEEQGVIFYLRSIFGVALRVYFPRSGVSLALADIYFWVSQPPEKVRFVIFLLGRLLCIRGRTVILLPCTARPNWASPLWVERAATYERRNIQHAFIFARAFFTTSLPGIGGRSVGSRRRHRQGVPVSAGLHAAGSRGTASPGPRGRERRARRRRACGERASRR